MRCWGINLRLRSETYAEQFGPTDRNDVRNHHTPLQSGGGCRRGLQSASTVVHYQSVQGKTVIKLDNDEFRDQVNHDLVANNLTSVAEVGNEEAQGEIPMNGINEKESSD